MNITDYLRDNILIADGATGTMLQRAGLPPGTAPEGWVLEHPERIVALHRSYLEAGSNVILTCTFGGSRPRLEDSGLQDATAEINCRAAELARQAVAEYQASTGNGGDRPLLVAGDIGPTGKLMEPLGPLTYVQAVEVFAEQASALAAGGVDLLYIETISDLAEARAAVEAARQVCNLPIFATLSFDTHGRTMMGIRPAEAARELARLGVTALGANCGRAPQEMVTALAAMAEAAPGFPLIAKPNAGMPRMQGMSAHYDIAPAEFAEYARQLVALGARVVGGCCGSTPDHIAAIAGIVQA